MTEYTGELIRVVNASSFIIRADLADSETIVVRFKLLDTTSEDFQSKKRTSYRGGRGLNYKYLAEKWFYERSKNVIINVSEKDIVGRWLGELNEISTGENLGEYLRSVFLKDPRWGSVNQGELKSDWFAGEIVTVPDGAELPVFHIWGKPIPLGMLSTQLGWLD